MNPESVLVRPHRRLRDTFADRARWDRLTWQDVADLERDLAPLPSEAAEDHERSRRFDLAVIQAQRALAEGQPAPDGVVTRLSDTARRLSEKRNVSAIAAAEPTLRQLQDAAFWGRTSPAELEGVRERIRPLAPLASADAPRRVYTDFEDVLGEVHEVDGGPFAGLSELRAYRERVGRFVREHAHHLAVHKLKHNEPLTPGDIEALEALLFRADAAGNREMFEDAFGEQPSLGLFVRRLIGLDRTAAKAALGTFLDGTAFNAEQVRFLDRIVDELTESGVMDARRLYESPYTDLHAEGLDGLFSDAQADAIVHALRQVQANTAA